ncbi:MAG: hypothetical protein ACUVQ0_06070 [Thermoproteota archaeon]
MKLLNSRVSEIVRFELEKIWSAPYLGIILMLLIMGGPSNSAPIYVGPASEVASYSAGSLKAMFLLFVTVLTFANSFGRDIEQGLLMGELTLPVKKGVIFAVKLLANFSIILLIELFTAFLSIWIVTASISPVLAASIALIDMATLLLFIALTILVSIVLKSRFGAIIVAITIYFFENILLFNISLMMSTVNHLNIDPTYILLRLVFYGEVTVYTWGIIFIHLFFPIALLSFAYFFFKEVLQLD